MPNEEHSQQICVPKSLFEFYFYFFFVTEVNYL